jgi:cytochrome c553
MMQPLAAPLARAEWDQLAGYYAALPFPGADPTPYPAAELARGRDIATLGIRGQGVPSCADCHGPGPERRNPAYPRLAGQFADYLVLQLELFKAQRRGGSAYAHIMTNVASRLRPEQMRAVARFYASLPADGSSADPSGDQRAKGGVLPDTP